MAVAGRPVHGGVPQLRAGASCADLAEWLKIRHRCKIHRSSIDRYLKKLPELDQAVGMEQSTIHR